MDGINIIVRPTCRIIPDTTVLIYMGKLNLLNELTACLPLVIPTAVLAEYHRRPAIEVVDSGSLGPDPSGRICTIAPAADDSSPLRGGEEACLAAYLQLKRDDPNLDLVVVTDDRQACTACRRRRIPFLNTPLLICALVRRRCLAPERGAEAVRHNLVLGRYGDAVTRVIREHVLAVTGRSLH